MKIFKHSYHISIIQIVVLFITTVLQSYLGLLETAALSCQCPMCNLWDTVLYDSLIVVIILMPTLSLLDKIIHLATTRLYLHGLVVLVAWAIMNTRLWLERTQCDDVVNTISGNVILDFSLPIVVGLFLYFPVYRWARKTSALLRL